MKKSQIKILSVFLIIMMLFCSLPAGVVAEEASTDIPSNISVNDETDEEQLLDEFDVTLDSMAGCGVKEDVSSRTESAKYFMLNDGSCQAVFYSEPVHRKDSNGIWQDIDNRLTLKEEKDKSVFSTEDERVKFSSDGKDKLMSLSENGYSISLTLIPGEDQISNKGQDSENDVVVKNHKAKEAPSSDDSADETLKKLKSIDNTTYIVYNEVVKNVNIEYVLFSNNVKENIIIKESGGNYNYAFEFCLEGLIPKLCDDGSIILSDSQSGQVQYVLPAPYMYDANDEYSEDVHYTLKQADGGKYIIAVNADEQWINSPDRAFPVTVDPTVYSHNPTADTYINSVNPNKVYGSNIALYSGTGRTAYFKVDLPASIPNFATITSATLDLYYYFNVDSGSVVIDAYQVTSPWSESTLTYNIANQNANLGTSTVLLSEEELFASPYYYSSNPDTVSFNITQAAYNWFNGAPNYGIALKYVTNPNVSNGSVIFKSKEAAQFAPSLTISYFPDYLPDGVYALKNVGSGLWMNVEDGSSASGASLQQTAYSVSPVSSFTRSALFKIKRIPGTNNYIIRCMTNNKLGIDVAGSTLQAVNIASCDSDVPTSDMFTITFDECGYLIRPYGSSSMIKSSNSSIDSDLSTTLTLSDYARWNVEVYTDYNRYGGNIWGPGFYAGKTAEISFRPWSTVIGANEPYLSVIIGSNFVTSGTWNPTTERLVITPVFDGTATIQKEIQKNGITQHTGTATITVHLPIDEGIYFFKNCDTENFMQIDDIYASNGYSTEGAYMELHDFDGGNHQKWQLTHMYSGYYTIKSVQSGKYVAVQSGYENSADVALVQEQNLGPETSRKFWKITKTNHGTYTVKPESATQYPDDWCMCAADYPWYSDGTNISVEQRYCANDSDYKDEWCIQTGNVYLEFSFDQGFIKYNKLVSSESDAVTAARISDNILNDYFIAVSNAFSQECGIYFMTKQTVIPSYVSDADRCPTTNIYQECTCISDDECTLKQSHSAHQNNSTNGFEHEVHCKSFIRLRNNLIVGIPSNTIRITYTGHKSCFDLYNHSYAGAGLSDFNDPIISMRVKQNENEFRSILVLVHEISHTYGAQHHDSLSNDTCVMEAERYKDIDLTDPTTYWCANCLATIRANADKYQ